MTVNERSPDAARTEPDGDPIVRVAARRFSADGFDAPLRAIAAEAGVSAALLMKRFGSKDGLRAACDAHVLEWIRRAKHDNIDAVENGRFLTTLASSHEYEPLLVYVLRSVMDGGSLGRDFVEHMIADAEGYMADAVARGIARPSRDERARTRYLVMSSLGAFLLSLLLRSPEAGSSDIPALTDELMTESMLPLLEIYTEGVFTTSTMLDDYLRVTGRDAADPS
ncbi:TetR/AcrR family transcriptional regulator [Microbacterium sp. G2-8]|uniref:TetR/AcrR family transcriptional regulator n=1 Tax=Microbacterium sp. G2-8 TaxID=2842454 RepID=UPI001C8A7331|nr:TetR family transcriptional regulator [Microbacterium sp. G2-8]